MKATEQLEEAPLEPQSTRRHLAVLAALAKMVLGAAAVVAMAGASGWGAYQLALTSPRFGIARFEVSGARRATAEQLAAIAGLSVGDNLLSIDLQEAQRRLLADPWIAAASVSRTLPSTVEIDVVEYRAAALTSLSDTLFLLDADGQPFKRWEGGDPFDLPVVTGVSSEDLARDREGACETLAKALQILQLYGRLPVSHELAPQELHVAEDGSASLSVGARGISLHLGTGDMSKKMLMVADILTTFERKHQLPGVVFLDNALHPQRVVVRMR